MGLLNMPRIPRTATLEQTINIYNQAMEEVEHRINGFLQSNNIQEVGGWRVGKTELISKDGDVGMSTEDTAGDDVRFFAGGSDKDSAPFQVRKSGKAKLTGARIESSSGGYPRYVLDPDANTFSVYLSASKYITISPSGTDDTPTISLVDGTKGASIIFDTSLQIISTDGIQLYPQSGFLDLLESVRFDSWASIGVLNEGLNLQQKFDQKLNNGVVTSSSGFHNHGIGNGVKLATTSDGVTINGFVTWAASGDHTHTVG